MAAITSVPLAVIAGILAVSDGTAGGAGGPAPGTRTPACEASTGIANPVTDKGGLVVGGGEISVDAGDSFFDPTCALEVGNGEATVTFVNSGAILHNVSVPALGIDENLPVGGTVTLTFSVLGEPVPYFCKFHRASGMVGVLTPA